MQRAANFFKEVAFQTGQAVAAYAVTCVTYTLGSHAARHSRNVFFLAANPETPNPAATQNTRPSSSAN